jgi:RNA polymerase sigma-70 factor (ECF subfamily)
MVGKPYAQCAAGKAFKINGLLRCGQASPGCSAAPVWYHVPKGRRPGSGGEQLASRSELSTFLAGAERRAFKQAVFAVRDEEAALDIVQDAMLRLSERYGDRAAEELAPLFQRILQNAIRDWFRRQKVRSLWTTLLSSLAPGRDGEDDQDPLETLRAAGDSNPVEGPAERLERGQVVEIIEKEIARLPARQREAFLMRYWEELDVAETARAMGCSEGSVKTHCSRATHALAAALRDKGITL